MQTKACCDEVGDLVLITKQPSNIKHDINGRIGAVRIIDQDIPWYCGLQLAGENVLLFVHQECLESANSILRPLPSDLKRTGFCSYQELPPSLPSGLTKDCVARLTHLHKQKEYDHQVTSRYHNYFFTPENWKWPIQRVPEPVYTIDAFSPNLNKRLHVGHLRQLALAGCMAKLLPKSKFVAMLGASQGIVTDAHQELYVYHDLAFANAIHSDYYITGVEQQEHFDNLRLGDKHLPMGLVLGKDGGKLKSREGDLDAKEAIALVVKNLKETPNPEKLAWNILAWNFLHYTRHMNVKFDEVRWTDPDSPGLYVTYSYARIGAALRKVPRFLGCVVPDIQLNEDDIWILGHTEYEKHYRARAIATLDPGTYANYALTLAKVLGHRYPKERIADGRPGLQFAMEIAHRTLGQVMRNLTMFPLEVV